MVVESEDYRIGEYVYVNPERSETHTGTRFNDERDFWTARILQIKALDPTHVYARVSESKTGKASF
jgi:hypothetical protein